MATFDESFLYPLILLLVGGGISVGLGTWLTHWLENRREKRETEVENHRKELEIKVELATRMGEVSANTLGEALIAADIAKEEYSEADWGKMYENITKWLGEANIIRSKLQSYYEDAGLAKAWFTYWSTVNLYYQASINYFQKRSRSKEDLKGQLKLIRDYFSQQGEYIDENGNSIKPWENLTIIYEESQWHTIYEILMATGEKIIKDVLMTRIKVF
jgi:hypothetical protein